MSTENLGITLQERNLSFQLAQQCIIKDLQMIKQSPDSSIVFANLVDNNSLYVTAAIIGPASTPYAGRIFLIDLKFSDKYPFAPPLSITFNRATMHPNIDECGKFRSNILKEESWLPAITVKDILEHIWTIMAMPDISVNEWDAIRAQAYRTNKEEFERTALEYSTKYAIPV